MGNIFTKRNVTVVVLSALAIGFLRKAAMKDKTQGIGKLADSIGLG